MPDLLALAVSPTTGAVIAVIGGLLLGFIAGAAAGASTVRDLELRAKLMRGALARIGRGAADPATLALEALSQDDVVRGAAQAEEIAR